MPQESLRSVVYRSFVTCEDPRGVVEGKTIRISKTDTTKMASSRVQNESQSNKEKMSSCKRVLDMDKTPSSYQLVEVKNGAQKLNQTIDSWSKGACFRGQSKDIAHDLLKGALDLQESLMMLGKLQEASCMTKAKKKQQEKPSEAFVGSDRFESFQNYDMGYRKQRDLVDGSSRDCYTELRDVIRDGLSKQNLLPNKSYEETFPGKRKLQLSPDIASTSSSRSSSMVYSTHDFTSSESFSSRATEKSKRSNLIAKLMGLEEFPSKVLPSSPRKQVDNSSRTRPVSDVDMPNAKQPQFFVRKLDREQMSLDEVIEMMQYKGLLRSNTREIKQTTNSYSEKRFRDDAPPIVLMKPQRLYTDKAVDNQKVKANSNSTRRLHQEKAKAEENGIKIGGKLASNKQKASVPAVTKPPRKQETEKKIDKIQKMAPPARRKPENVKSTNSVSKVTSPKQVKPQRSALANPVSKRMSSSVSTNGFSNQKKTAKIENPVNEPLPMIIDSPKEEETETEDSEVTIKEVDNGICKPLEEVYGGGDAETRKNEEESSSVCDGKSRSSFEQELLQECVKEFSRTRLHEEGLMREMVKAVEDYSKVWSKSGNADRISGLLERDLRWSRMGGVWSCGWKDGFTVDEVVLDMEKIVLSKLIDDMLMELVFSL